tara:strand:- start:191 stop:592 length:402 start_codon:yes stop_codon:yes gene_type:complete
MLGIENRYMADLSLTSVLAEVTVNSVGWESAVDYINGQVQNAVADYAQTLDELNEIMDNHYLSKSNMMTHVINAASIDECNAEVFTDAIKHTIDCSYAVSRRAITLVRIAERITWLCEAFKVYNAQSNPQEEN